MTAPVPSGPAGFLAHALARPGRFFWTWAAVAWAETIFVLSARPAAGGGAEPFLVRFLRNGAHAPFYAILAAVLLLAIAPRARGFPVVGRKMILSAVLLAVLYGASDEWHQRFVVGRDPSLVDLATDAFGATFGGLAVRRVFGGIGRGPILVAALGAAAAAAVAAL